MRRIISLVFAGALALGVFAAPVSAHDSSKPTIVGVAVAYESAHPGTFSTLISAVTCTGLVPALNTPGAPYLTVFAPTDAAFTKLGLNAGNICSALDAATLTKILEYHVVPGDLDASKVVPSRGRREFTTLLGQEITVNRKAVIRTETHGKSTIIIPDVQASNGVIHVIDTVLMPDLGGDHDRGHRGNHDRHDGGDHDRGGRER
jgi:uncharacterized surface protein with fasciclin (FAS1) repeats